MTKEDLEHIRTIYDALEKQIPQEPSKNGFFPSNDFCPKCGEKLKYMQNHCGYCGQAISWIYEGGRK
jgi:predicted amidophosphoribosyltransferase